MITIAVCMAVFNRREITLTCLRRLVASQRPDGAALDIYVLDDASTDGTGAAVATEFPAVHLLTSKGDAWWAGGMRIAYGAALAKGYDFYIWMNDDVAIDPDAIECLIGTYAALKRQDGREHMVSGAMLDRETGRTSYGGSRLRHRWWPTSARLVEPSRERPLAVDLVNGNMLLIPRPLAERIGNIPEPYLHSLADWDYGLRARALGAGLWLAPGHVGSCAHNVPGRVRWGGRAASLRERYRRMLHPLALPLAPRRAYMRAHFPVVAPLFSLTPYLKLPFDHLLWRLGLKR